MGPGEGARVLSLTAFGQQPVALRTSADVVFAGPVITSDRPTPLDGQFSTDGGDRALLLGLSFAPPDLRSVLAPAAVANAAAPAGGATAPAASVPALVFPLALPLPAGGALPTCALRINFGGRCLTGASDAAGLVPRSVANCRATAHVSTTLSQSPYAGVSFLQTNADAPAAAAALLNRTVNASTEGDVLSAPFLTVATSSGADGLVFETPPGVGVNISVSLSVLDGAGRELWRSNAVRQRAGQCGPVGTALTPPPPHPHVAQVNFSYDPPGIIRTQPSPLFVSAPGGSAAVGAAVTTASAFALTLHCKNVGRLADVTADDTVSVVVGGVVCASAQRVILRGLDVLQCSLPATAVVGYKNLTVTVAGQTAFIPPTDPRTVLVVCAPGSFGHTGEACAPCPAGATCAGYVANAGADLRAAALNGSTPPFLIGSVEVDAAGLHTYPAPLTGWFNLNGTSAWARERGAISFVAAAYHCDAIFPCLLLVVSGCPPGQGFPGRDVCVVPCIPSEACIGANVCAPGYVSRAPLFRCGYCAPGFYRSNAVCVPCPTSPAGLVVGFALVAIAGAGAAYYADRKKINVAFVAIGIDYAQVRVIIATRDWGAATTRAAPPTFRYLPFSQMPRLPGRRHCCSFSTFCRHLT